MPLTAHEIEPALHLWPELQGGRATLINHSENHTFRIDTPDGGRWALRVHRSGYQSRPTVGSELAWLKALHEDTRLPLPEPVAGRDGALLQQVPSREGERMAVLFRFLPGREPQPEENLVPLFGTLGRYAATLHDHARRWTPPQGFNRQVWKASTILDRDGLWGDWRVAPGVDSAIRAVLDRLDAALRQKLAEYGDGPDRFGLIHADMRLGNLLVDGETVHLIDFDDCGLCWFAYDFAAAISFHETDPAVPALRDAWFEGYQAVAPLHAEHIAITDTMVMLRRMILLAWIGSHNETQLAQHHMPGFAEGTAELAQRYLRGAIWP